MGKRQRTIQKNCNGTSDNNVIILRELQPLLKPKPVEVEIAGIEAAKEVAQLWTGYLREYYGMREPNQIARLQEQKYQYLLKHLGKEGLLGIARMEGEIISFVFMESAERNNPGITPKNLFAYTKESFRHCGHASRILAKVMEMASGNHHIELVYAGAV